MARRRGFSPVRGSRRRTGWEEGVGGGASQTIAAAGNLIVGAGLTPTADGMTLVRTRGELSVYLSSINAVADEVRLTFGIGITTAEAFAVGATAVPSPNSDMQWDGWLWWKVINLSANSSSPGSSWGLTNRLIEIDSKAMRKVGLNEVIFLAMEFSDEVGAVTAKVMADTRMLFKLP